MTKNFPSEEESSSTDLNQSLWSIFHILGSYDTRKFPTKSDYLRSLGKPAIMEIISRFEEVLALGCDEKMDDFVLPQTRNQDHYAVWETLWYVANPQDPRDDYEYKKSTVISIETYDSWLTVDKYDLNIFFENWDTIPLRSIRVVSQEEVDIIKGKDLLPRLEKLLSIRWEEPFIKMLRKLLNQQNMPARQEEVKGLINVLLQRQQQVVILPGERQSGHYKAWDLVWYYPNDLYDRDMRWAEDDEYYYHFGKVQEAYWDWEVSRNAKLVIWWREFSLRSYKVFSCEEIIKIHNEHLFEPLKNGAGHFEGMMPEVLFFNIQNWLKQAEELKIISLEDFFKVKEATFERKVPKRI
ncbi:MAG: hypothetical protein ACD_2C00262G0003 [uncultured bacterium (gcode 4)]|uniref:Uncharacterized protein n=1 Tax=uncultured bacterium (gcode 4) TaxID=1234023 RepID=K2GZK1_9BACT|nr:MAG: hypothetical protein ACD_2C00262G0003 [uncultured bacterium (gcode 4)]